MLSNNNKSSKTISIALCTCNGQKYLSDQLQSIVDQTLKPDEIVICDDASEDKTLEIIDIFVKKYPMIQWIVKSNIVRMGVRLNFEQAIMQTSCNYIATSDQDDIWELNKLELLLKVIQKEQVALVHSGFYLIDAEGKTLDVMNRIQPKMSLETYIFANNNVTGCTCFFDAELKNILYPFPHKFYYHDRWLAIVAYNNGGIYFYEQPLISYRQHSSNVVATLGGGGKRRKDTIKSVIEKAEDILLLIRKKKDIKYSWAVYFLLLRQYCTCRTGIAWLKMRL